MSPEEWGSRVTTEPGVPIACPVAIVVNRAHYAITEVYAQFRAGTGGLMAYGRTEHFSSWFTRRGEITADLDGPERNLSPTTLRGLILVNPRSPRPTRGCGSPRTPGRCGTWRGVTRSSAGATGGAPGGRAGRAWCARSPKARTGKSELCGYVSGRPVMCAELARGRHLHPRRQELVDRHAPVQLPVHWQAVLYDQAGFVRPR
jgi:hypothetical protein